MDEFSFLDDLQKKREQAQPVQKPVNSLGEPVRGEIDNAYANNNDILAQLVGRDNIVSPQQQAQPQQQEESGFWEGVGAGAGGVATGLARLGQIAFNTDGKTIDQAEQYLQGKTGRSREWTVSDMWNDPWGYITSASGARYGLGNQVGSMLAMTGLGAAAGAALPSSVAVGTAGMLANVAGRVYKLTGGRIGMPLEAAKEFMQTPAGKALVAEYMGRIIESGSEGGSAGAEKLQETGDINEARKTAAIDSVINMGILTGSGALNAANVAGMIGNKEKGKLARYITGELMEGAQQGFEEGSQQTASEYSQGKAELENFLPWNWSDSAKDQAVETAIVSPILGGARTAGGKVANSLLGNQQQNETNDVEQEQYANPVQQEYAQEETEFQPQEVGSNDLVNRVRALEGQIPFYAEDGTNCMRTMGIALAGTPYEGQSNVDQAIATATELGQLMDPETYTPRPGDLAVNEDGDHIVMVTENGGTIQNGKSANGVYESDYSAEQMSSDGKVKYYIRTSDYSNGGGGPVASPLGSSNELDYTDELNDFLSSTRDMNIFDPEQERKERQDAIAREQAELMGEEDEELERLQETVEQYKRATKGQANNVGGFRSRQTPGGYISSLSDNELVKLASNMRGKKVSKSTAQAVRLELARRIDSFANKTNEQKRQATRSADNLLLENQREQARDKREDTLEQSLSKARAEVNRKTANDFAIDRALDALQAENDAQMRANRRTDFATSPFMPSTYDTNPRGTAGFRNLAEAEREATGRVNTATLSPEELARTQDIADNTRGRLKVRDMIDRIRGERAQAKQQALDYEWMAAEHERNTKGVANAEDVRNNPAPNVQKAAQSRAMQDVTQRAMAGDHGAQRTFDRMGKAVKAYLMQREIDRLTNESDFENQLASTPDRATEPFMPAAYEKLRKEGRGKEYEKIHKDYLAKNFTEGYRSESGRTLMKSDADEFVVRPNGSTVFGVINEDISKATNGLLTPGEIKLKVGDKHEGLIHAKEHNSEAIDAGYNGIEDLMADVAENFDEIYERKPKPDEQNKKSTFVLVKRSNKNAGSKNKVMPIYFELSQDDDGNYYLIVTAIPKDNDSFLREITNEKPGKKETLIYSSQRTNAATSSDTGSVSDVLGNEVGTENTSGALSEKSNVSTSSIARTEQVDNNAKGKEVAEKGEVNENESKNEQPQVNETRENNNENSESEQVESNQGQAGEGGENQTNQVERTKLGYAVELGEYKLDTDNNKGAAYSIDGSVKQNTVTRFAFIRKKRNGYDVELQTFAGAVFRNRHPDAPQDVVDAPIHFNTLSEAEQYIIDNPKPVGLQEKQTVEPDVEKEETPSKATDNGIEFIENEAQNGLELKFPGKPDDDTLNKVKGAGFKWNGRKKVWYVRKTNQKAVNVARELGYKDGKETQPEQTKPQEATTKGGFPENVGKYTVYSDEGNQGVDYISKRDLDLNLVEARHASLFKEGSKFGVSLWNDSVKDKDVFFDTKEEALKYIEENDHPVSSELSESGVYVKAKPKQQPASLEATKATMSFTHFEDGGEYPGMVRISNDGIYEEQGTKIVKEFADAGYSYGGNEREGKKRVIMRAGSNVDATKAAEVAKKYGYKPKDGIDRAIEKIAQPAKTGNAVDDFLNQHVQVIDATPKPSQDLEKVKQYKKDFESKLDDLVKDFKEREFSSVKAVRDLEKEANDKLEEYENEALKDKVINRKTVDDIVNKAEDKLNEAIKEQLQKAKANERPAFKPELGEAKLNRRLGANGMSAHYETDTKRFVLTDFSNSKTKDPFRVDIEDKTKDIVSGGVTLIYNGEVEESKNFATLEEAENFITDRSKGDKAEQPQLPVFEEGLGGAQLVQPMDSTWEGKTKVRYKTDKKSFVIEVIDNDYPYHMKVYNRAPNNHGWNLTEEGTGDYRDIETLKSTVEKLVEESEKVVESKVDKTTKEETKNDANSGKLQDISEEQVPEGLQGDGSGRDTGRVRRNETGGNVQNIQPSAQRRETGAPSSGGRPSGESKTGERTSSNSEGSGDSVPVRRNLNPEQKKNAKAKEHPGHNYTISQAVIEESQSEGFKAKTRFKNNVAAIRLIHQLEAENRLATPAEQEVLAKYIGWGGLSEAFSRWTNDWKEQYNELQQMLKDGIITREEYSSMERSTTSAFYTPYSVVKNIWDMVERFGFKGGRVLEPSMGTGNFFGIMPEAIRSKSSLHGIEYDKFTGKIAKQLYQKANVEIMGFEESHNPENFYDLIISNVPFGEGKPRDLKYNKEGLKIHNYFFKKSVELARPGGLVVFVTSTGTMGKNGKQLRKLIGDKVDFVGAIRLPDNTFKGNAGTSVTSDLIILQKRDPNAPAGKNNNAWLEMVPSGVKVGWQEKDAPINEYFKEHPEMLIGETVSDRYGNGIVQSGKDKNGNEVDVAKEMAERINKLPANIYKPVKATTNTNAKEATETYLADSKDRIGTFKVKNGKVYSKNIDNKLVPLDDKKQKRALAYVDLRDVTKKLMAAQISDKTTDEELDTMRKELNKVYDDFVKKFGYIHTSTNSNALSSDPEYGMICGIERYDEVKEGNKVIKTEAEKGAIFTQRTVNALSTVTKADNVVDGLSVSLAQQGIVDVPYIAKLTGKSKAEVLKELKGLIYQDPVTQDYVTKDEYLSGNVREKLENARQANTLEGKYKENIAALEKIVPKDLEKEDITISLGSVWVPPSDFQDFAAHMLGCAPQNIDIQYNPSVGWKVELNDPYGRVKNSTANTDKWGTAAKDADERVLNRKTFIDLLEIALNKKSTPKITISGGEGAVSKSGTLAATGKIEEIKKEFDDWIWSDKERTERLVNYYNNHFNSYVPRVYNGDHLLAHLTDHGYSTAAPMLRPHQTDAVWRIMQGNTLLAHSVGAGKTWTMQTAAMEMKRLGIARKPMFVIPGHMLQQFENEFRVIYPNARLLSISTDSLPDIGGKMTEEKRNQKNAIRQETLSRIALEDWDGIIISHDMFKRIPMSPEQYAAFYQEELDELENVLMSASSEKGKRNNIVKDLQAKKEKLEERLKASANVEAKDIVIPFESLGVDQLFVDEADLFKNLHFTTMMGNISGLANSDAQRSTDMYIKTRYLSKTRGGSGVCFATGTPVSNSLAEEFTMLRYLAYYDRLQEMGLQNFDAWASAFTKQVEVSEVNPSGNGFRVVKKLKFSNGGDLMRLFRSVADVKRPKDLNLKVPKLKNGKRTVVELPKNSAYDDFLQNEIWPRAEAIRNNMVEPEVDNMLKITSEQRLASLDMRLVKPGIKSEDADAKIQAVADRVYDKFVESTDIKGAQLVFCDLSTPKGQSDKVTENESVDEEESGEGIVVYEQILKKLVAKGIPKKQIAFAHDAKSKAQKEALFNKVRSGEIRVLIGSTTKMGAGTNCQERLVALHHVDAPWRPRDIEQREGRIIRQGNMNDEVEIFTYVTKGSFDESMWGRIAYKSEVIEQALSDDFSIREFDDIGPETLSYADIQAAASGNPLLAEQTIINSEVSKLLNVKAAFENTQRAQRRELAELPAKIKRQTELKKAADADVKATIDVDGENFRMEIGGKSYNTVKDATEAFEKLAAGFNETVFTTVGKIGHYTVQVKLDSKEYTGDGKYKNKVAALLVGNGSYIADGSVQGIKYRAMHAAQRAAETYGRELEDNIKKQKDLEQEVNKSFPRQAELEEKQRIQQNIAAQIEAMTVDKNKPSGVEGGQASLGDTDVERSYEEVLQEAIKAFPGAEVVREGGDIFAKLPNGPRIKYNIVDEVMVSAEDLSKAQKAHNLKDTNIQGYFELDKNGVDYVLTVSRKSKKGAAYHEALHAAMQISLTDKENKALINYYSKNANGKAVNEAIGDAYRDWRVEREEGRGTIFGKLFQKVYDFCTRVAALFNEGAKARAVFLKIESGETNTRKAQNRAYEGRQYSVGGGKQPQQRTVTRQELQKAVENIVPLKVEKDYRSDAYRMYNRKANVGFVHAQGSLNELNSILGMYVDTQKKLSDNSDLRDELLKNAWDYQQDQKKARKFANAELSEQVKEGAAYFGRLYATDKDQAKALFPKYFAAFERAVNADKALKAKVNSYLETAEAFYKQTPEGRAKAGLTQLDETPTTWKEKVKTYAKQAYVDWFDDKDVLRRVEREIETITGEKVKTDDSAYFQARVSNSSAASRVDMVVNGPKTKWGKAAAKNSPERKAWYKALNSVYRGAWKHDVCYQDIVDKVQNVSDNYLKQGNFKNGMDALGSYLLANRFLEIWETKPNYKASMSKETAEKVVANAPKAIKEAADLYYKFDDNLIGVMNKEGMLSDEGLKGMRQYTRYCPLFRDFADEAAFDKFMSSMSSPDSYINLSNGIKALTEEGSDRTVLDDPTKSMLRMTASILGKVEKNKVGQKFVALSERSNVGQFVIPAVDPKTGKQLDTSNPQFSRFTVWENGEKKAYITLPEVYDVLENTTHASAYAALLDNMIARGASSTLRKGATISMGFMIRNFIRDTIGATLNSKNGFIPLKDSIRGMSLLLNDAEFRNQYLASGANMAGYFKQDAKSLENMLDEMAGNGWWQKSSMLDKLHMMWEHYEQLGELIEQGTRAGEFKKALEKNKSLLEAAIDAKEVTLDFSRAGAKGRQFNRIIPFFNAVLQGGDKMVRTAIENPQKTMTMCASLALATMLLWAINHNDDWYKELDNESKYSNWHFHVGDKHFKIPKPQEFGMLSCASVEAVLEQMFEKNPKAMSDWASQFVETMTPSLLPALYRPILEVCANYDYHFQSAIVGKKYQNLVPEAQINSNTSEFAKLAGRMAGYSPIKIDHLVRGYFGGAGAFVARIPNKVLADGKQPAKYWNEMPVINEFVENDFAHSKSVNNFYEILDAANKQHTTYGKKGQPSAEVLNIRKYGTIISGLRKDIQKITANQVISPERKRQLIDNKTQRIYQVARKAVEKYGAKYL